MTAPQTIGPAAVEGLIAALRDADGDVDRSVVEVLGSIGDTRAVKPLIGALAHPGTTSTFVVALVARALGLLGDVRAIDVLVDALRDDRREVRREAAVALRSVGAPAVEPLIALLRDPDPEVRSGAVDALGRTGDHAAVEPLVAMLDDGDEFVQGAAVGALRSIGEIGAVPPELAALREQAEPLLVALRLHEGVEHALIRLEPLLERSASAMDADLLRRLTRRPAGVTVYDSAYLEFQEEPKRDVSYAKVKEMASQELSRRGLPV